MNLVDVVALLAVLQYLVGRVLYWRAYVSGTQRGLGFNLSIFPVFGLVIAALVPAVLGRGAA